MQRKATTIKRERERKYLSGHLLNIISDDVHFHHSYVFSYVDSDFLIAKNEVDIMNIHTVFLDKKTTT
jgi:hypothetical protein